MQVNGAQYLPKAFKQIKRGFGYLKIPQCLLNLKDKKRRSQYEYKVMPRDECAINYGP